MPSLVYNSCLEDLARGAVDFDTDAFKLLLVGSGYTASKGTHSKRSAVTSEVTGTGYTAGGMPVTVSVTRDNANNRVDVGFSSPSWPNSTITARGGVIYKARGGAASADELVAYLDFGSDVSSTNGNFTVTVSSPLRLQN